MAQKSGHSSLELRKHRIDRKQESQLTVAKFCEREGITQAGYYYWKRRLREHVGSRKKQVANRTAARANHPDEQPAPQVPTGSNFVQLPMPTANTSPWIELLLNEGTVIRIPQQNTAALATVLQALGRGSHMPRIGEARHA